MPNKIYMQKNIISIVSFLLCFILICGCTTPKKEEVKPQKIEPKPEQKEPTPKILKTPSKESQDKFTARSKEEIKKEEQIQVLFNNYLTSAKNYANQNKYDDAYFFVLEALKIIPDHNEAIQMKKDYGRKLGMRPDEIADQMQDAEYMVKVKIEQTKVEVDNRIAEGKRLIQQKKYDEAIVSFKQAKELLRWMPYQTTDLDVKSRQLDFLIQKAEEENTKYKAELKEQRIAEATEQAKREEEARLKTLQEQTRYLFRQANLAFEREQYDLAENFCQQVSTLDPDNQDVSELIPLIREARHSRQFESHRLKYLEEWKKIFAQIDEAMVPSQQIVQFPSYENWKNISQRGAKSLQVEEEQETPKNKEIRQKLESEQLSMDFVEAPLDEVIGFLRTATNINITIDPEVYKEYPEEEALKVDITISQLKLIYILDLILSSKRLAYYISDGALIISTKKRIVEKSILRLYNVRDLTGKLNDFPSTDLTLSDPTDQGGGGVNVKEEENIATATITEEQLTDIIKNNIAKGTWENEGHSIDTRHGTLIIRQVKNVHEQIEKLLNDLRKATGLLVTIEAKFLTVTDNFLEDVGVDWRGLGATALGTSDRRETDPDNPDTEANDPALEDGDIGTGYDYHYMDDAVFNSVDSGRTIGTGRSSGAYYKYGNNVETRQRVEHIFDQTLGNNSITSMTNTGGLSMQMAYLDEIELQMILKAVRKRSRSNQLSAPRLTVFNTQRANVTIVRQVAYVQDYSVEIATNSTIADPIVGTVQEGVILDVRPIISADRKYITLELQPTVAELDEPMDFKDTQLASSASSGPGSVRIELPNITMTKIKTTVTIPDGGTLLLGGLMRAQKQDFMSGLPFLSDLPIINFFTSRKGKSNARSNVLVLVTATITSMEEQEPKQGVQR